jgi:rsbT co-antagonist protein RsbR
MSADSLVSQVSQLQERVRLLEQELQLYRTLKIERDTSNHIGYLDVATWFEQWLEVAPDPTLLMNERGEIIHANSQLLHLFGYERDELIGQSIEVLVPPEVRGRHVHLRSNYVNTPRTRAMAQGMDLVAYHKQGYHIPVEVSLSPMDTDNGALIISSIRNVTERRLAEQNRLDQEVIRMQRERLDELSTPLLPINDDIVVMPLIGTIDEHRADLIMETLLYGINQHQASIALIDITGVPYLDANIASSLVRCTQAAQLLGAHIVLTGISSAAAKMLVDLDIDLNNIVTQASLKSGIAYALQLSNMN